MNKQQKLKVKKQTSAVSQQEFVQKHLYQHKCT